MQATTCSLLWTAVLGESSVRPCPSRRILNKPTPPFTNSIPKGLSCRNMMRNGKVANMLSMVLLMRAWHTSVSFSFSSCFTCQQVSWLSTNHFTSATIKWLGETVDATPRRAAHLAGVGKRRHHCDLWSVHTCAACQHAGIPRRRTDGGRIRDLLDPSVWLEAWGIIVTEAMAPIEWPSALLIQYPSWWYESSGSH
ncbi:hypothetical protein B0H66DRAFT_372238 [Apodospora peruviana]|uniref:Secreted protein n=1 Tax=Apodospora peruviana TaxID=516989 RepID=A0AAE0M093_9PEZI|nr:hypothetical protein B0H66DRAFT_372238 [Apodospora peruviana]